MIFCTALLSQCVPPNDQPITEITVDVKDAKWQKVVSLVDSRNIDSLYQYLSDSDPTYRYLVAKGMAYGRRSSDLDSLYKLLRDPVQDVRSMAAVSIGLRGESASAGPLLSAFKSKDTLNVDNHFNGAILEAVGRTGGENLLKSIATVSTYRNTDTLLLLGQAKAIYRYALRGITIPEGTDKMVQYVTEEEVPQEVRVVAANYLLRAKGVVIDDYKYRIGEVYSTDADPYIRMALAGVLGRTGDQEIMKFMLDKAKTDPDYRVRVNTIRAMGGFPYISVVEPTLGLLSESNSFIAESAADYLIEHGNKNDAVIYRNFINDTLPSAVNAKLYSAVLKHIPVFYTNTKSIIKQDLLKKYEGANSVYEKANYLRALGFDPYNYITVSELLADAEHPVLKTAAMEAMQSILRSNNFARAHRSRATKVKREILDIIKAELQKGDVGSMAVAGDILSDATLGFKDIVDSTNFIQEAASKLELPREVEIYNSLMTAQAYLSGATFEPIPLAYNHPINYGMLSTYGDSVQVAIKLEKGVVRLRLHSSRTPGSVANFLSLCEEGFYDGKVFHRVVPNFVVQAGCPRGDGYGSLDYSIRTEATQSCYDKEGYIGMASAGQDTEATQWFITHSPAMHLDGNYTIFGEVTKGMDVLHQIQQGDVIQDVIITKN